MTTKTTLHLSQEDVYYDYILSPNNAYYSIGGYVTLHDTPDINDFKQVLTTLPEVFDVFRIQFDFSQDKPLAGFKEQVVFNVTEKDFSDSKEKAIQWMQARFQTVLDINGSQLYECFLIKISATEYYWFFRCHHILIDLLGYAIIVNYVLNQYQALQSKKELDTTIAYPAYQNHMVDSWEYINSDDYLKDKEYWEQKFKVAPELLLKKHKKSNEKGSESFTVELSEEQRQQLAKTAQQANTSVNQLTLAAMSIYFAQIQTLDEVVLGIPIHGRWNREQKNTAGMFSKYVLFQSLFQPDQLLQDFLKQCKSTRRRDYPHQKYPIMHLNRHFNLLLQEQQVPIDVIVNYAPFKMPEGNPYKIRIVTSHDDHTPLQWFWFDYGDKQPLVLHIDFQKAYFTKKEIDLFSKRILFILEQFQHSLDQPIGSIEVVPPEEKQQLLAAPQRIEPQYNSETVVSLFETQVDLTPEAVAAVLGDDCLTYQALNEKSNQMAHYLIENGVKPGDYVGLYMHTSFESLIGLWGILKAGAGYVFIDPDYPQERVHYMLADASVKLLITNLSSDLIEHLTGVNVVKTDKALTAINEQPVSQVAVEPSSTDSAYAIYTSGSTGKPKGIAISHASLLDYVLTFRQMFGITWQDRVIQQSSWAFDILVEEIYPALTSGATLLMVKEGSKDVLTIKDYIENHQATLLTTTPTIVGWLNEELSSTHQLRWLISGGELLKPEQIDHLFGKVNIANGYGPSETTVAATFNVITNQTQASLIGKPVANKPIYIVNEKNQLQPVGVVGEICIGGTGLAQKYLNRPKLTRENFPENPFVEGERMYKTGDLGRWLPNGNIEFLGRKDEQVKIRGYRIELSEIENVLRQSGLIKDGVVLVKKHKNNKHLVAYVVPQQEQFEQEELLAYAKEWLPHYMIPSLVVPMDELPMNTHGKLDKKALPKADFRSSDRQAYVAPTTPIEQNIAVIWRELLGVEKIGVHDNFFELGGQSILAVRLIAKINASYHTQLPVSVIFKAATVALQAAMVSQRTSLEIALKMNDQQKGIPIFCVPGAGGNPLSFFEMAKSLEQDHPVYVLQNPAFDGVTEPLSFEKMAEVYVQAIQKLTQGPYILAGYSAGGRVAYEMARQLQLKNNPPQKLIVLDVIAPIHSFRELIGEYATPEMYLSLSTTIYARYFGHQLEVSPQALSRKSKATQLEYIHQQLTDDGIEVSMSELKRFLKVCINDVSSSYSTQDLLNIPILLICPEENRISGYLDKFFRVNVSDWNEFTTAGFELLNVSGNHFTMLGQPHVQSLSQRIKEAIQEQITIK
ncbi:amino acid adenylation domain-containing protein [uncultured Microscilla sp.]|uniref:amino acid adenylation domain-containing protein n=1 Tax=uncultured Microscilla sp. TaxID=432653 RepID=UPI00261C4323|nr:amino acid adenylation domain-containing protein [uncultured Microscilla sp.]